MRNKLKLNNKIMKIRKRPENWRDSVGICIEIKMPNWQVLNPKLKAAFIDSGGRSRRVFVARETFNFVFSKKSFSATLKNGYGSMVDTQKAIDELGYIIKFLENQGMEEVFEGMMKITNKLDDRELKDAMREGLSRVNIAKFELYGLKEFEEKTKRGICHKLFKSCVGTEQNEAENRLVTYKESISLLTAGGTAREYLCERIRYVETASDLASYEKVIEIKSPEERALIEKLFALKNPPVEDTTPCCQVM